MQTVKKARAAKRAALNSVLRIFTLTACAAIMLAFMPAEVNAQSELIIEPGAPGHINEVITGDTTATGERNDPDRVYVLRRGATYLFTEEMEIEGYDLTVVAEDGDGPRPVLQPGIIPGVDEAPRPFRSRGGNMTVKGIYFWGIDNAARAASNATLRVNGNNVRVVIDDCHFDGNRLNSLQIDTDSASVYITNSIFSNIFNLNSPDGWVITHRSNYLDTLIIENTTFYNTNGHIYHHSDQLSNYIRMEHNTFVNVATLRPWYSAIDAGTADTFIFKNNVVQNVGLTGLAPGDTTALGEYFNTVVGIDSIDVDETTTVAPSEIEFRNNLFYLDDAFVDVYPDTLSPRPWVNPTLRAWMGDRDLEDLGIIIEEVDFADAPETQAMVEWLDYYYETGGTNDAPFLDKDPRATTSPNPPAVQVPVDFSYSTSSPAYSASTREQPLGDLNWFGMEIEGEETNVSNEAEGEIPQAFRLNGNYPNPFNPSTTVRFDLHVSAEVNVEVYDLLGRKVLTVAAGPLTAGSNHGIRIDASGLSSGVYLYRVNARSKAGMTSVAGQMILLK